MTVKVRVAIDPGGTSGIAWRMPDGSFQTTTSDTKGIGPYEIYRMLQENQPEEIIVEAFNPFTAKVDHFMLLTIDLVGGIKAAATLLNVRCEIRQPAARMNSMDEAKALLREARKRGGFVVHEVDALAHLLAWEKRESGLVVTRKDVRAATPRPSNKGLMGR